uniref:Secreted protein n=1 Tax=Acrobeloides nanus TaxID=290746 RepID=A0A914DAH8_9BILA
MASIDWNFVCNGVTTIATLSMCALQFWQHFRSRQPPVVHRPLEEVVVNNNAAPNILIPRNSTENKTEKPTEKTDNSTEKNTEKPTEKQTDKSEKKAEKLTDHNN